MSFWTTATAFSSQAQLYDVCIVVQTIDLCIQSREVYNEGPQGVAEELVAPKTLKRSAVVGGMKLFM